MIPFTTLITLSSDEPVFTPAMDLLSSSVIYTLPDGGDPLRLYGMFVRRLADYHSAPGTWRRIS